MTQQTGSRRILAGRYSIGSFIGQGGMATVYKGTDTKLGRPVAIKVMKAELADDEDFRLRFRQEAQSASRMAHPTIVRVFDAGDDLIQTADGPKRLPFIVMEYVDGKNLREMLSEGPLTIDESCRVIDSVLTALEYSHRAGIVHRDIKPANIMITKTGQVKVMDFGIARAVSETSSTLQQTTTILGTAAYFSPEQAKGESIDARTDLYSTAVMLYELLAGSIPFSGDTAVAIAYQHVSERAEPPSERNPEVTPELDRVTLYGLQKDRAKRFQTAAEFRGALRLAAKGEMPDLKLQTQQSGVLFSAGEEVSEDELALRQITESGARTQHRPPVMWTWAAILTIGAVIAAVIFWLVTLVPQEFSPASARVVPEVVNMARDDALAELRDLEFVPNITEEMNDTVPNGMVISTDPVAGTTLNVGDHVTVTVSTGPAEAKVPEFTGISLDDYKTELQGLGLVPGSVSTEDDPLAEEDQVIDVSPKPGKTVKRDSKVEITVSSGRVEIPDLVGHPQEVARSMIDGLGLDANFKALPNCPSAPGFPISEQSLVGKQPQGSSLDIGYCGG